MRSRLCRQAKKEEAAVRRNPKNAALIQSYGSRSSLLERHGQQALSNSCSKRQYRTSGFSEQEAGGEEKEDWEGDWDDEKVPSGMKALRWISLWILIGVKMHAKKWCSGSRHLSCSASAREREQDGRGVTLGIENGEQKNIVKNTNKSSQGKDPKIF